jgi:molybdopterin synthase sulfur carrier subunit
MPARLHWIYSATDWLLSRFSLLGAFMAVTVLIPTPLRPYTDNLEAVEVEGETVAAILQNLITRYGDLKRHLLTEGGQIRNFVNIYVNDEDVRHLEQGQHTPITGPAVISIVPSIAGGGHA